MEQLPLIAPLWTVQDVSEYLRVPVQTLYSWRSQGSGPLARRVGKYLRYRPADVEQWLEAVDTGRRDASPISASRQLRKDHRVARRCRVDRSGQVPGLRRGGSPGEAQRTHQGCC